MNTTAMNTSTTTAMNTSTTAAANTAATLPASIPYYGDIWQGLNEKRRSLIDERNELLKNRPEGDPQTEFSKFITFNSDLHIMAETAEDYKLPEGLCWRMIACMKADQYDTTKILDAFRELAEDQVDAAARGKINMFQCPSEYIYLHDRDRKDIYTGWCVRIKKYIELKRKAKDSLITKYNYVQRLNKISNQIEEIEEIMEQIRSDYMYEIYSKFVKAVKLIAE